MLEIDKTPQMMNPRQQSQTYPQKVNHNVDTRDSMVSNGGAPTHEGADTSADLIDRERALADATIAHIRESAITVATNTAGQARGMAVSSAANVSHLANVAAVKLEATLQDTTNTAKTNVLTNPRVQVAAEQLKENLSPDCHEMAHKDYGIYGAVQQHQAVTNGTNDVRDIGWHRPTIEIPDPLIGGLPNGKLFSMIRRFNKDVFDVRAVPPETSQGLDLNESWSDKHAADKLPLHLQRVYLSIVLGMASLGKQVARLRSWKETRRTSAFCLAYFIAWIFDLLVPLVIGVLIAVVSSKEARDYLFPPAPLALVSIGTGGIQKPQAGSLGTSNTLTGAPEKEEGEAVEEEAANFAENIRHLIGRAVGMHGKEHSKGGSLEKKMPKPIKHAAKAVWSPDSGPGHAEETQEQTEKPMEQILWDKANPEILESILKTAPHAIGEVVDNWERFAK